MSNLLQADVLTWLRGNQWLVREGYVEKYHAVFCDPPYFLGSIAKRFGPGQKQAQYGRDGLYQRQSRGFMGQTWDGFEDLYHYQAWATEWGALLLDYVYPGAFGLFFGGTRTHHRLAAGLEDAGWEIADEMQYLFGTGFPKSHNQPGGYGTALKPAYEPVIVARAPRGKHTYAHLFETWGIGSFNIDGARVDYRGAVDSRTFGGSWKTDKAARNVYEGGFEGARQTVSAQGRWPSNVILDDTAAAILDAMSGERGPDLRGRGNGKRPGGFANIGADKGASEPCGALYADSGGPSRFFYTAKAASWEREAGLGYRDVTPRSTARPNSPDYSGKFPDHDGRERRCTHPTVKPLRLNEYLARLILPPEHVGERRLLVPFAGVGSEVIGAKLAGWEVVTGLERETAYVEQGQSRLAWWSQFSDYASAKKAYDAERKAQAKDEPMQLTLLEVGAA